MPHHSRIATPPGMRRLGVRTHIAIPQNVRITPCGVALTLGARRDIQVNTSRNSVPVLCGLVGDLQVDFSGLAMLLVRQCRAREEKGTAG